MFWFSVPLKYTLWLPKHSLCKYYYNRVRFLYEQRVLKQMVRSTQRSNFTIIESVIIWRVKSNWDGLNSWMNCGNLSKVFPPSGRMVLRTVPRGSGYIFTFRHSMITERSWSGFTLVLVRLEEDHWLCELLAAVLRTRHDDVSFLTIIIISPSLGGPTLNSV